jgi:hypothetical protein
LSTNHTRTARLAVALLTVTVNVHAQGTPTPAEVLRTGQFGKVYRAAIRSESTGQLQATWNSFFGRQDLDAVLHGVPHPSTDCKSADDDASDARAWLLRNTQDRKILMFNDDHMHVGPRAFLLQLLPQLRRLGFSQIGFEALLPQVKQGDGDLAAEGFYTVEPLFAALPRDAGGALRDPRWIRPHSVEHPSRAGRFAALHGVVFERGHGDRSPHDRPDLLCLRRAQPG